jgi:hypothetical protein
VDTYTWLPAPGFVRLNDQQQPHRYQKHTRSCPAYGNTLGIAWDGAVPRYGCAPIPGAHSCTLQAFVGRPPASSAVAIPDTGSAAWESARDGFLRFSYNAPGWGIDQERDAATYRSALGAAVKVHLNILGRNVSFAKDARTKTDILAYRADVPELGRGCGVLFTMRGLRHDGKDLVFASEFSTAWTQFEDDLKLRCAAMSGAWRASSTDAARAMSGSWRASSTDAARAMPAVSHASTCPVPAPTRCSCCCCTATRATAALPRFPAPSP